MTVSSTFDTSYFMHKSVYNKFKKCCEAHIEAEDLTKAILDLQEDAFSKYEAHIQSLSSSYGALKCAFDTLSAKTRENNNKYIDSIKIVQSKLVAASDSLNAANQNIKQLKTELNKITKKSNRIAIAGLITGIISTSISIVILAKNN